MRVTFLSLFLSVSAFADCHFVSRDGVTWTKEKSFCFEQGEKLDVKIVEKEKAIFEGKYVFAEVPCEPGHCEAINIVAAPEKPFAEPETWPEFPVLQWLPANYNFVLNYRKEGDLVTGLLNVYDTDIARFMVFCNADPATEAGKACRTNVPVN